MLQNNVKICLPDTATSFPRERLFKLLDDRLTRSAVWIQSPAGSGKTTLVASYCASRALVPLWYQLDSGDSDVAGFFHDLGVAVKRLVPRKNCQLLSFAPEYLNDINWFTTRYLDVIFSRLPSGSCIVFDNYQDLPNDANVHKVVNSLLDRVPRHIRIILISRGEPPAEFIRHRANAVLSLVGWQQLRLNLEEAGQIACLRSGTELSEDVLSRIYETTDGWAAGLTLLLEQPSWYSSFQEHRTLSQDIFDYFASQVLENVSQDIDNLLMATSFYSRFTTEIAQELTGLASAAALINSLIRGNFFITRHVTEHTWYQYHPLFKDYLQARAQEKIVTADLNNLCARAALVAAKHGLVDDQVRLLCRIGDWETLVEAINTHAPVLLNQGRGDTVAAWLSFVPPEVTGTTPWFLFWESVCLVPVNPLRSRTGFESAARMFQQQEETAGMLLAFASSVDLCFYTFEFTPLDDLIPRFLVLLDGDGSYPNPDVEYRVTMSVFNALSVRMPGHSALERWRVAALQQLQARGDIDSNMRVRNIVNMVTDCVWRGNLSQAGTLVALLKDMLLKTDVNELHRILAINIIAIYAMFADVEAIPAIVEDGCILAKVSGISFLNNHLISTAVVAALSTDNYSQADMWLNRMEGSLASPLRFDGAIFNQLTAWRSLAGGFPARAFHYQQEALRIVREIGWTIIEPCFLIGMACIHYAQGNIAEAETLLSETLRFCQRNGSRLNELMCRLVEAEIAYSQGHQAEGNRVLTIAINLWRTVGACNLIWFRPAVMADLCVRALEADIEADFVCSLIRRRNLMPAQPPLMVNNWPWTLRITTLGKFQIERDGIALEFSGKVQKKPLELLKALIAFGGCTVDEHILCDVLWADGDGDKAHAAFATTLFRLRQLLGNEQALIVQNGQLSLDRRLVWVDVWAFEYIVQEARLAWNDPHRYEAALELTERAVTYYTGEFLPGDHDKPWSFALRERLKNKFIFKMETLCSHWEQSGDSKKAIRCYHSALEIEPHSEEFYQRLMLCYHRSGQRAEAVTIYKQCRYLLKHALSITPSPETEAIYQSITSF